MLTAGLWLLQAEGAQQAERADLLGAEIRGIQEDLDTQLAQQQAANDASRYNKWGPASSKPNFAAHTQQACGAACPHRALGCFWAPCCDWLGDGTSWHKNPGCGSGTAAIQCSCKEAAGCQGLPAHRC